MSISIRVIIFKFYYLFNIMSIEFNNYQHTTPRWAVDRYSPVLPQKTTIRSSTPTHSLSRRRSAAKVGYLLQGRPNNILIHQRTSAEASHRRSVSAHSVIPGRQWCLLGSTGLWRTCRLKLSVRLQAAHLLPESGKYNCALRTLSFP